MKGHLIHIGFPKTGSTFLQGWFQQNPHMYYAPGGVGGFYNVYQISHLAAMNNLDTFQYFVTSDESLSTPRLSTGSIPADRATNATDLRPAELAQKNVSEILKTLYPDARILLITRGFKGVVISGYSQYIREGGVMSLPELIQVNLEHISKSGAEADGESGFNYAFIANRYEEAFGKENVLTLPFELLRDDQREFLSVIEKWLGIPHFEASTGRVNESLSPQELYWYPRISALVSTITARFGKRIYNKVYRWYVHKVFFNKLRRPIKILTRIKPDRSFSENHVSPELLAYYRKNNAAKDAGKFKDNPFYKSYLAEYLLD